jgi:hypothetical protein
MTDKGKKRREVVSKHDTYEDAAKAKKAAKKRAKKAEFQIRRRAEGFNLVRREAVRRAPEPQPVPTSPT